MERLDENGHPVDPATRQRAGFLREPALSECGWSGDAALLCGRCGARFHSDPRAVAKWRGREVQRSLEPHVLPPYQDVFVRHRPERVASVRRPPQLHVAIPEDRRLYAE